MATTAPINFDVNSLRTQVIATYDQVAREPNAHYHFHRGPDYARDFLGYEREALAAIPVISTRRFAGVGNPLAIGPVRPGSTPSSRSTRASTRPCRSRTPAWTS